MFKSLDRATSLPTRLASTPRVVAVGLAFIATSTAALAITCWQELDSVCSTGYSQPADGCPDQFIIDWQIIRAASYDAPGLDSFHDLSCYVYVQKRVMILGACEDSVDPPFVTFVTYRSPTGNPACDEGGGGGEH